MKNKHRIKQGLSLLLAGGIALANLGAALPAFAEGAPATPETASAATPETAEANVPTPNLSQITENLYDDLWGQRFIEVWSGMPTLFLIILLSSVVQPNFWWLLAITVLFGWMSLVGVVRAEFLRTRNFDYIRAAQALGVSDRSIILRHMLPNAMVATLTFLPFILCSSITTLTSLDFLGFGLPLGSPSLGELLLQGKNNLQAPWLGITAFLSVAILLSLLIFIGEAVRDAFDPNKAV